MDASVVIPVKNGGELFKKVLDKVLTQKTDFEYEVICVDSGSSDGTLEYLQSQNVRLYQIPSSEFGHGKTRNFGASKSDAEFVVFITQDALPADEHWLNEILLAINQDDKIAGAFGKHLPYPDCNLLDKHDLTCMFNDFDNKNHIYSLTDKHRYEKDEGYRMELAFFSDNNSCVRKSVFDKYPYPDVQFAEDQIWMRKMIENGYKKAYASKAAVYHSHNFSPKSYYRRYYDEYKGIYDIHQFCIANNKSHLPKLWLRHVKSDFVNIIRPSSLAKTTKLYWLYYSFVRNYSRYYGGYKGGIWHALPSEKKLKYDKKYSQQKQQRDA